MNSNPPENLPPTNRKKKRKVETSFFLDSIPYEILETVLRFFSRIPNAKNWETYIDVRNLVKGFGLGDGFGTLLKSRFHTLVVSRTKNCDGYELFLRWKERPEPCLWTKDIAVAHEFVVAGGGRALRTLVIGDDMYKRGRDGENLVDDFVKHCPSVTSLSIGEGYDPVWTNKFGGQLEVLEVYEKEPMDFPENASALRELNMNEPVDNFDTLQRIGGNLERLIIRQCGLKWESEYDKIKLYCPKLKSIFLGGQDYPAIVRLLVSYGDRLEDVLLNDFIEDEIRDVTAACPNARFHLSITLEHELSPSDLNLIGPRLEGLTIEFLSNSDYDLGEWTNAWNQCRNLRHLEVSLDWEGFETFQVVFSKPKNRITSIGLNFNGSFYRDGVKKAMADLANGTKIVEKFSCTGLPDSIDGFDGFFEKNRASLRSISLRPYETFADGDKKLDDLLKSLLQLPALEELYVDYQIPQDILNSLRTNGVYCGSEYL